MNIPPELLSVVGSISDALKQLSDRIAHQEQEIANLNNTCHTLEGTLNIVVGAINATAPETGATIRTYAETTLQQVADKLREGDYAYQSLQALAQPDASTKRPFLHIVSRQKADEMSED